MEFHIERTYYDTVYISSLWVLQQGYKIIKQIIELSNVKYQKHQKLAYQILSNCSRHIMLSLPFRWASSCVGSFVGSTVKLVCSVWLSDYLYFCMLSSTTAASSQMLPGLYTTL